MDRGKGHSSTGNTAERIENIYKDDMLEFIGKKGKGKRGRIYLINRLYQSVRTPAFVSRDI